MTEPRNADLEVLVDLTTTTHGQGRTVEATRVESEFAAARPLDASRRRTLLVTGAGWLSNVPYLFGLLHARHALGARSYSRSEELNKRICVICAICG